MMKAISFLSFAILACASVTAHAQKLDTTVTMNKEGYRVICSNKDLDNNYVTIQPVKLTLTNSRQIDFPVKGKIAKAAVDDLTDDGEPDLIITVYGGTDYLIGNVIGISYDKANKTIVPMIFPDIYNDPKLREGYKGHDTFTLTIGTLIRKFPIYLPNDAPDKPTGGIRSIQYKAQPGEGGRLKFIVLRSYDSQPEN